METDQLGRLREILEAAKLIASYVADTTDAAFRADRQKQDAVIRRIQIIGEAAAHLTEETRQAIPELPTFVVHDDSDHNSRSVLPTVAAR